MPCYPQRGYPSVHPQAFTEAYGVLIHKAHGAADKSDEWN